MSTNEQAWHALSAAETLQELNTDAQEGLTADERAARLKSYGYNELQEKPPISFWERLWAQLSDFVVLILIFAAIVSALMGDWIEAIVIMSIVVLNSAIGVFQESKAEEALAALKKMAAPDAHILRDGHRVTIPSRELVPGDVVLLEAGNIIPADVRLLESINLKVEEASLTGESMPVNKQAAEVLDAEAGLGDRHNCAYMSTMVSYGRGRGVVVATGMQTEIGKIAEMIQSVEEGQTPLQRKLDELGKALGVGSLVVCGLVFVAGVSRAALQGDAITFELIKEFFMLSVSLAIAAVPEGLPAVVTVCLAIGMQKMVERNALIRKLPAVETLGSATVICSDKTGTLTQNAMTVTKINAGGREYEATGRGYTPQGEFRYEGKEVDFDEHPMLKQVLLAGTLCNDAILERSEDEDTEKRRMVGDPTEGAMVVAAAKAGYLGQELESQYPRVSEIPFDSKRKRMTTIHDWSSAAADTLFATDGAGQIALVKGAPDIVLEQCTHLQTEDGVVALNSKSREAILEVNADLASQALRVLAVAYRPLDEVPAEPKPEEVEHDLIFIGLQGMIDPSRPEVVPAVRKARGAGLRTIMVTGDYAETAKAIAREIGILRRDGTVISGKQLERMSDAELQAQIEETDVFARVSPHHKVRIVKALQNRDHVVAMTGDGVNDAPALKQADIGVAMGITGTDVSKQTADMVLTDDNYVSIVSAIEQGRIIYSNIRKFVYFLLSCNLAEIAIIFIATLLGWPSPLTVIQLLWLNLLSDGAPALALGLEAGDPDLMDRPPRPPKEPVINREMISGVVVQTIAITVTVLIAYWRGMTHFAPLRGVTTPHDVDIVAQTMAFVTLVLSELFRAYTARSEHYPLLKLGIFSNKWMQYATGFSVVLLLVVVYVPFLEDIFDTVPLYLNEWIELLPLVLLPSIVAELQKWIVRMTQEQVSPSAAG